MNFLSAATDFNAWISQKTPECKRIYYKISPTYIKNIIYFNYKEIFAIIGFD
jgi:hypothetical protein